VISNASVKDVIINFPKDVGEQKEIVETIKKLLNNKIRVRDLFREKIRVLDKLKNSLLQKAFSGELVKEVNINQHFQVLDSEIKH